MVSYHRIDRADSSDSFDSFDFVQRRAEAFPEIRQPEPFRILVPGALSLNHQEFWYPIFVLVLEKLIKTIVIEQSDITRCDFGLLHIRVKYSAKN